MQIILAFVILIAIKCSIATKSLSNIDNDELEETNRVIRANFNESGILASSLSCKHRNAVVDLMLFDNNGDCVQDEDTARKIKRQINKNGPKAGQKSLLIIFDGTGSMCKLFKFSFYGKFILQSSIDDDLVQLKSGAKAIIDELAANNNHAIHNYVLVVFRDPS